MEQYYLNNLALSRLKGSLQRAAAILPGNIDGKYFFSIFHFLGWILSNIVGRGFLHLNVKGLNNISKLKQDGVLFVANHCGPIDPFMIGGSLPVSFMLRARSLRYLTYYKFIYHRWYGFLLWLFGAYPVYKNNSDYKISLGKTVNMLRKGYDVLIFPTSRVREEFKTEYARPGVAWLAARFDPIIVPVFIKGTYKISVFSCLLRQRSVLVKFGKPLKTNEIVTSGANLKEQAKIIMEKVKELEE